MMSLKNLPRPITGWNKKERRPMIPSSIRYVAQGAERYVSGDVVPYDQRNEMFKRPFWEPQKEKLRDQFYFSETPPEDEPGYRLSDMALVNASWRLEREYALGVRGGRMGMYSWDWNGKFAYPHVPEGLKIDTKPPAAFPSPLTPVWGKLRATAC